MKLKYEFTIEDDPEKIFDLTVEYFALKIQYPYEITRVEPYAVENLPVPKSLLFERGSGLASFMGAEIEKCKTKLKVSFVMKTGGVVQMVFEYDIKTYGTPLESDIAKISKEVSDLKNYILSSKT